MLQATDININLLKDNKMIGENSNTNTNNSEFHLEELGTVF